MPENQLTRTRIEVPNQRPPDPLRGFITGPRQCPRVVFRRWETVHVCARSPLPLPHGQRVVPGLVPNADEVALSLSPL